MEKDTHTRQEWYEERLRELNEYMAEEDPNEERIIGYFGEHFRRRPVRKVLLSVGYHLKNRSWFLKDMLK